MSKQVETLKANALLPTLMAHGPPIARHEPRPFVSSKQTGVNYQQSHIILCKNCFSEPGTTTLGIVYYYTVSLLLY